MVDFETFMTWRFRISEFFIQSKSYSHFLSNHNRILILHPIKNVPGLKSFNLAFAKSIPSEQMPNNTIAAVIWSSFKCIGTTFSRIVSSMKIKSNSPPEQPKPESAQSKIQRWKEEWKEQDRRNGGYTIPALRFPNSKPRCGHPLLPKMASKCPLLKTINEDELHPQMVDSGVVKFPMEAYLKSLEEDLYRKPTPKKQFAPRIVHPNSVKILY